MMQVNDRGSKKWTALMLPEHVEALKKLFAEQDHKEKPILDEQQMIDNEFILQQAIENDLDVEIKCFEDHDFHTVKGKLLFIDAMSKYLQLDHIEIKLENIIEVNLL